MKAPHSDEQGDIVKSKGLIICRCPSILSGAKAKGKGNTHHIGLRFSFRCWIGPVDKEDSMNDQCDGDRLEKHGRKVVLFKLSQLRLNTIINHIM